MVIGANVHAIGFSMSLLLTTHVGKVHLRLVLRVFSQYTNGVWRAASHRILSSRMFAGAWSL
jgi:hypothetical protein